MGISDYKQTRLSLCLVPHVPQTDVDRMEMDKLKFYHFKNGTVANLFSMKMV